DPMAAAQYAYLCAELEQLTGGRSTCNTSGLPPQEAPPTLQVFPNPAHSFFTVRGIMPEDTLRLLDLNGRVLMMQRAEPTFDVRSLTPGIYLLQSGPNMLRILVSAD
ncbi:MAG: Secretion system C-terminal sorting domain, partial [Bacteroidota bacterium]